MPALWMTASIRPSALTCSAIERVSAALLRSPVTSPAERAVRSASVAARSRERVSHVWRVDRRNGGCGAPVHLAETVNIGPRTYASSIAADNSIYFLEIAEAGKRQLYRARWSDGRYQTAEALPFSSPATADVD